MHISQSALRIAALSVLLCAGAASGQSDLWNRDGDVAKSPRLTPADVLRWFPVDDAALRAQDREFRWLARKVASGSNDIRILRAYARLYPRLFPFDKAPDPEMRIKALAALQRLSRAPTGAAPPSTWTWQPLGPRNIPGRMTALALHPTDPNTVFTAAADGGIWRTTDLGQTWTPLSDFEPTLAMGALALDPVDPDVLYAGTGEGNYAGDNLPGLGVMKSTDAGATWTFTSPFAAKFHDLVIDPRDRARLWAATTGGLFRSTDSGANWAAAGGGLPATDTSALLVSRGNPDILLAATGSGSGSNPDSGLWRSTDAGASWAMVPSFPSGDPVGRVALAQCQGSPEVVYAAIHRTDTDELLGIYRSGDEGASWSPVAAPQNPARPCNNYCWYCLVMAVDPGDPQVVYLGGVYIYRSTDGGASWTRIDNQNSNAYVHVDQHHFVAPAPGVLWSANDGGINVSYDYGTTWSHTGLSLETAQYYHFTTDPVNDAYATGGTQDQGTHQYSSTPTWGRIIGADGGFTAIDWNNPLTWYGTTQGLRMYRSTYRGLGMRRIGAGIDPDDRRGFIAPFILDRSGPGILLAGTMRLWRSVDRGMSFIDISPELAPGESVISAIDNCRDQPLSIWVGTNGGLVWNTPDGGANWRDVTAGLPPRAITSVSVHPALPATAYVTVGGTGTGHIWKTTDFGQTWLDRSLGLPDIHFNRVLILEDNPAQIVAACDLGVYLSQDSGMTWMVYGTGLPNVAVDWISYAPATGTLRAGTHGRGAWQLVPPGACPFAPEFAGLASIRWGNTGASCQLELEWPAARCMCEQAPAISYNIYRSTDPLFFPDPSNLLQAGLTATRFVDTTALPGQPYHYYVSAEDGQTVFGGPTNGGKEDPNIKRLWATAGDGYGGGEYFDDGGDTVARLESTDWSIQDCANITAGGRYAYHTSPSDTTLYTASTCATLTTPPIVPATGALLTYWARYNLETGWDGVVVEVSTDEGGSWTDLPPVTGYPGTLSEVQWNACGLPQGRPAFTGPGDNSAAMPFMRYTSSLGSYIGRRIRIRWLLSTDVALEYEGFDLDDIRVRPIWPSPGPPVGNTLMGWDDAGRPSFTWTDLTDAYGYRSYHFASKDLSAPDLLGEVPSGVPGFLDTTPRPEPVHYYHVNALITCYQEGP